MNSNDIIMQTVTKVVLYMIITFSIYLLFAGHYFPGGGFIGGLMTASALVLLLLAFDYQTVERVLPVDYKILTAIGLLLSVLTGLSGLLYGLPFLTHYHEYVVLPLLGRTGLTTAMLFDLGVYLVVIGIAMTIFQSIGVDKEWN